MWRPLRSQTQQRAGSDRATRPAPPRAPALPGRAGPVAEVATPRAAAKDMVTVYSLIVVAPAGALVPVGDRRGRNARRHRFRAERKFLDTRIRHAGALRLLAAAPPLSNMVTVIETAFLAPLVACVGSSARTRSAHVTAARAIDLSTEVAPANEEDAHVVLVTQALPGALSAETPRHVR